MKSGIEVSPLVPNCVVNFEMIKSCVDGLAEQFEEWLLVVGKAIYGSLVFCATLILTSAFSLRENGIEQERKLKASVYQCDCSLHYINFVKDFAGY